MSPTLTPDSEEGTLNTSEELEVDADDVDDSPYNDE